MQKLSFLFLGNTSFGGLSQREHALATELARRGFPVTYVEGMPSLASRVREVSRRFLSPESIEQADLPNNLPPALNILTPPTVPTFFRSSYTPGFDALLFRRWFREISRTVDWRNTVVFVSFPYWWNGFVRRSDCPAKFIVYDVCDSLSMPSRNDRALSTMMKAEEKLIAEVDLITCSAFTLEEDLRARVSNVPVVLLPNAVSNEFLDGVHGRSRPAERKVIGYVGSLDPRWADRELLVQVAEAFPDCYLSVRASVSGSFKRRLKENRNVRLERFMGHIELAGLLEEFDVCLIPFLKNHITRVVNPLKLYEYCAAGKPSVAIRTEELRHYDHLLYLADSADDFINHVRSALTERDGEKRNRRIAFARENTWRHRVDTLLSRIP